MLQVNITVYTAQVAVDEVANSSFELLTHPLYSADLALSDSFLFHKIKSCLRGQHFGNKDEIICVVEEFLQAKMPTSSEMRLQCLSIVCLSELISLY